MFRFLCAQPRVAQAAQSQCSPPSDRLLRKASLRASLSASSGFADGVNAGVFAGGVCSVFAAARAAESSSPAPRWHAVQDAQSPHPQEVLPFFLRTIATATTATTAAQHITIMAISAAVIITCPPPRRRLRRLRQRRRNPRSGDRQRLPPLRRGHTQIACRLRPPPLRRVRLWRRACGCTQ